MPNTHCLPTGSLGTSQIGVCQISPKNTTAYIPSGGLGVGGVRGVAVWLTGIDVSFTPTAPSTVQADVTGTPGSYLYSTTLKNSLVADGWIVLAVPYNENYYSGGAGTQAIYNDINADVGNGSRYLATTMLWWDHVVTYIWATYGATIPIVPYGFSWGAWHAAQIAIGRQSTIKAFVAHCLPTWLRNVDYLFTGVQYGAISTAGLDLNAGAFAGVTIPGVVGYGQRDLAVGWNGVTTVASGSNGVAASSVSTLNLASNANMVQGVSVTATGLTGGAGWATWTWTGTGTNTLTGCTLVGGSGTLATGNPVTQSTTTAILAGAPANITGYAGIESTGPTVYDGHELSQIDATYYSGTYFATVIDPLCPKAF